MGAGVQSTTLYVLATRRDARVPQVDCAIFADTGDEPAAVYAELERMRAWGLANDGPPIHTVSIGRSLSELMETHYIPIPAFTLRSGQVGVLRRQCTTEITIKPIQRFVREQLLGLRPGEAAGPARRALCLKGFSAEEIFRVKPSREPWLDVVQPPLDTGLYRWHCQQISRTAGLGTIVKSACIYCPYHGDREWARMKREDPEAFEKACRVDEGIRQSARKGQVYEYVAADGTMASRRIGTTGDDDPDAAGRDAIYLHPSCRPLREIEFGDQADAFESECDGYCGI